MNIKHELKEAGIYIIAYWDSQNPNVIMLTSVEKDYNYLKRGRGFRPASDQEILLYEAGTRIYEKKVHK